MPKRTKPSSPSDVLRKMQERKATEAEIARIRAQGATVKTDRAGKIVSAFRANVFTLLLERKTITANQYYAAYTLCRHWAQWKGLEGQPEGQGEKVDGSTGSRELVTDRMINGGLKVEWALSQIGPADRVLLEAFMFAAVEDDRPMDWKSIVLMNTGVRQPVRQSQMVVSALENLRLVYEQPRRAAA